MSSNAQENLTGQQQQPWAQASTPVPPPTYSSTSLTPYLTLPHHISLTWIASPILSLLFIVFRLLMSMSDAQNASDDAKHVLLASCDAAQTASGAVVNIPRFMAEGVNAGIEKSVNDSIDAAKNTMIFALTALEGIIEFLIDMYKSTFLCFVELAVRATLGVLIDATESFNSFITSSLNSVRTGIQNDVSTANNVIAAAVSGANKLIPSFLNLQITVPAFTVPSLSGLQNVTLPTTIQDGLTTLNSSIPTLDDIRDSLDQLIEVPFNALKADINASFSGMRFNATTLPVPQSQQLTFCNNMDTSVVDDLVHDLVKVAKIGCFLLLAIAVLLILGNCFIQWYRWRSLRWRLERVREAEPSTTTVGGSQFMEMSDRNLLSMSSSLEHPLATAIATRLSWIFRLNSQKTINLRFFFNYVFYPPALACFLIGFFGLLSVEIQLVAIAPVQRHYQGLVAGQVNDFSLSIADSVNNNMQAQSSSYADSINAQIDSLQTSVNQGVFGWVNGTVVPLNNTLEAFYTDIQNTVTTIFGGTVLESPMQEFIRCLIGSKVQALENAFTFVQDNFQVNIRQVDPGVLMLSNSSVEAATAPISAAAIGGGTGNNSGGVVGKLVNRYVASLEKERLLFLVFLGLWLIVVFMAIGIILWHSYGRRWVHGWNKRRHQRRTRGAVGGEGIITPWVDSTFQNNARSRHSEDEVDEKLAEDDDYFGRHPSPPPAPPPLPPVVRPTATAPVRKSKISLPVMNLSNLRPSAKEQELPAQPKREVIQLDSPLPESIERKASSSSGEGSNATLSTNGTTKKKRESRKLVAHNRRPVRETLVPDPDVPAGGFARGGSEIVPAPEAPPPSDGGFLLKLSGIFGRKGSEEDDWDRFARPPASIEPFGRRDSRQMDSITTTTSDPHSLAPQPHRVELVKGERRKSVRGSGVPNLPPLPHLPQQQQQQQRQGGIEPPPTGSGMPPPQRYPSQRRGPGIPIHHHFVVDPRGSRVIPYMPFPLAPQAPLPPPPPQQQRQQHRRTMSDSRQLYPAPAPPPLPPVSLSTASSRDRPRKSSLVDPALVNMNLAGIGSRGGARLSMLPAGAAPAVNPFTTPFDDEYRVKSGQWVPPAAASKGGRGAQEAPPLPPGPLAQYNPFLSPVATAF